MRRSSAVAADDGEGDISSVPTLTVDDQLALFSPLMNRDGMVKLTAYASNSSLTTLRWRGKLIPPHRLHYAAARLEALAVELRELARRTPVRRRITRIKPELYADLGLVLGDEESRPSRAKS